MAPKEKTVTVLVMAKNIYDPEGGKRLKRDRFECDAAWAKAIIEEDEANERERRLEIL